jgi:hypothetical protein
LRSDLNTLFTNLNLIGRNVKLLVSNVIIGFDSHFVYEFLMIYHFVHLLKNKNILMLYFKIQNNCLFIFYLLIKLNFAFWITATYDGENIIFKFKINQNSHNPSLSHNFTFLSSSSSLSLSLSLSKKS